MITIEQIPTPVLAEIDDLVKRHPMTWRDTILREGVTRTAYPEIHRYVRAYGSAWAYAYSRPAFITAYKRRCVIKSGGSL